MTIHGIHYQLQKAEMYETVASVPVALRAKVVKTVFIDSCCEFFSLLQNIAAKDLVIKEFYGKIPGWHCI